MNEKKNKMKWLKIILVILVFYPWVGGMVSYLYTYYYSPIMEIKKIKVEVIYHKSNRGGGDGLVFVFKDFPMKEEKLRLVIGFDDKYYQYFKDKNYYIVNVKYKINSYDFMQFSKSVALCEIIGDDGYYNYKESPIRVIYGMILYFLLVLSVFYFCFWIPIKNKK